MSGLSLGIDLGTSGIRTAVVDPAGAVLSMARADYGPQNPNKIDARLWWEGAARCITHQVSALKAKGIDPKTIERIAVDGTSGSMVLVDNALAPVTRALMYNTSGFEAEAAAIARRAPAPHITRGANSALARMLRLQSEDTDARAVHMLHQADFIAAMLMGRGGLSDHNNALKTGYDPASETWPAWAEAAGVRAPLLPHVRPAGAALHPISRHQATDLGLSANAVIHAGTTDSIAAFLAAAPLGAGAAVTSLGTTLAVKLLSPTRIDAPELGLYSHRLADQWLTGGASNTGGGVLRHFFSLEALDRLSAQIHPETQSTLDYYPLITPGERFPVNDPSLAPRLTPRPASDADFLHGLLEGIARIEARCYQAISDLGGTFPQEIHTAGGGGANPAWSAIRARVTGAKIKTPMETEAAIGTARLTQSA